MEEAESFKKEWQGFYDSAMERIQSLEQSLSEIKEEKSSDASRKALINYSKTIAEIIKPLISIPYTKKKKQKFGCHNRNMIFVDGDKKIKKIKLWVYEDNWPRYWCFVFEKKKGIYTHCVRHSSMFSEKIDSLFKRKKSVEKCVKKLLKKDYAKINEAVSNLDSGLKALFDYMPKHFMRNIKSLENSLEKSTQEKRNLFSFSDKLLEIGDAVTKARAGMKEYGLCRDDVTFSVCELLSLGFVPKVKAEKIAKPVMELFSKRDQKVPQIMEELKRGNLFSFHSLLKTLEARARASVMGLDALPVDEVRRDLSYFERCGIPVDDLKRIIIGSVERKERKRKKKVSAFISDVEAI